MCLLATEISCLKVFLVLPSFLLSSMSFSYCFAVIHSILDVGPLVDVCIKLVISLFSVLHTKCQQGLNKAGTSVVHCFILRAQSSVRHTPVTLINKWSLVLITALFRKAYHWCPLSPGITLLNCKILSVMYTLVQTNIYFWAVLFLGDILQARALSFGESDSKTL